MARSAAQSRSLALGVVLGMLWAPLDAAPPAASAPSASDARTKDPRIPFTLDPARRANFECLMRGHLEALSLLMKAVSAGDYAGAATLADERFSLTPGTKDYCREPLFTREASLATLNLPPAPPDGVKALFASMHAAADAFRTDAHSAATGGDPKPALKSLASLAASCHACHAAYRLD